MAGLRIFLTLSVVCVMFGVAMFVSSDSGLVGTLNHADALAQSAKVLREAGFDEPALNRMFKENPARLIKLPPL
jgi:hypothetical protein